MSGDDVYTVRLIAAGDGGNDVADVDREEDAAFGLLDIAGHGDCNIRLGVCCQSERAHLGRNPIARGSNAPYGICLVGERVTRAEGDKLRDYFVDALWVDLREDVAQVVLDGLWLEGSTGPNGPNVRQGALCVVCASGVPEMSRAPSEGAGDCQEGNRASCDAEEAGEHCSSGVGAAWCSIFMGVDSSLYLSHSRLTRKRLHPFWTCNVAVHLPSWLTYQNSTDSAGRTREYRPPLQPCGETYKGLSRASADILRYGAHGSSSSGRSPAEKARFFPSTPMGGKYIRVITW